MNKKRKKVAYVLSQFPSYDETFILREMKGVERNGLELSIFSLRPFGDKIVHKDALSFLNRTYYAPFLLSVRLWMAHFYYLANRPIKYLKALVSILFPYFRKPNVMVRNLVFFPKSVYFARIIDKQGISHVHAGWATYPATAGLVISKLSGASFSFAGHAHDIHIDSTALSRKINAAEFVVTCTAHNKEYLQSLCGNGTAEKVHVSYHGLDLTRFEPNGRKQQNNEYHILSVGSLLKCKGFNYLIEACAKLRNHGMKFKCVIVGGGKLETELREKIAQLQLNEHIELVGYVTQEEIVKYYHWADVFTFAAVLEIHWGIPNVVVEAAAAKVPVIITPLPSLSELIEDGKSGLFVPNRDALSLSEALKSLYKQPSARQSLAEAAYHNVQEKFDENKTIGFLTQLFEGAVN